MLIHLVETPEEKQTPKFSEYQTVIISGSVTGVGDVKALITQIEFSEQENIFYYTVKSETDIYYSPE